MESRTKTEFTSKTIAKLVHSQFGSTAQITKIKTLTAGWFNSAYEIEFADEIPAVVLRIAPDPNLRLLTYEKEMMRKELLVYKTVNSAADTGMAKMPIPQLIAADTSRTIIDRDFMIEEKFSGKPLDELKAQIPAENLDVIHHQIGVYMAALHTIKNDRYGYFGDGPGHGAETWREAFSAFIEAVLNDGRTLGEELPYPYHKIRALFHKYAPLLDAIQEPVLVHWDMWPVNIFIIENDSRFEVEGIIDWERAYWGDPESEPAIATQHYGAAFFKGYGRELTTGQSAVIRRKLYQIYLLLIMKIEAKVRFEDAGHLTWVQVELTKELAELEKYEH